MSRAHVPKGLRRVAVAIEAEAARLGVTAALRKARKHLQVVVTVGGQTRKRTVGDAERDDGNTVDHACQTVRRITRELRP